MKILKKVVMVVVVAALFFSFSITIFADNTYFTSCRFYTPIFSVDAIGNFNSASGMPNDDLPPNIYAGQYNYGSIIQPPTDVMIPDDMFYDDSLYYLLRNERDWTGFYNTDVNAGTHQSAVTTRFYNEYDLRGNLTLRSETNLYSFSGTTAVMGFLDEVCVKESYFDSVTTIPGYKIFDGFTLTGTTINSVDGIYMVTWCQYENVDNGVELVRRHVTVDLDDISFYEEVINGQNYYVRALPFFDVSLTSVREVLDAQIDAYNDGELLYYMQDIEFRLYQNGSSSLNLYNTYDKTDEITSAAGGYLRSVTTYIDFEDISYTDWLVNSVGGFMGFEIIPGFTLGGILAAIIALLLLRSFLKIFAGG